MISNTLAQQLHDRATRGEWLTMQEQEQLNEWYAREDAMETQQLGLPVTEKIWRRCELKWITR